MEKYTSFSIARYGVTFQVKVYGAFNSASTIATLVKFPQSANLKRMTDITIIMKWKSPVDYYAAFLRQTYDEMLEC